MNEDTAAQAVAAASAEGSKDWMHELWQRLQAVGPGLLGRLGGERLRYALELRSGRCWPSDTTANLSLMQCERCKRSSKSMQASFHR